MERMKEIAKRGALGGITAISAKLKWNRILGTNMHMNLFNMVAPANGVYGISGVLNVLLADLILFALSPKLSLLKFLRWLPMLLATAYFAELHRNRRREISLIAFLFMLAFWAHPTGRKAWSYALLWIITLVPLFVDNLYTRALSSQMVDHAIGSLIFLYTYPIPPDVWISAIPVALMERLLFALGQTATAHILISLDPELSRAENADKLAV